MEQVDERNEWVGVEREDRDLKNLWKKCHGVVLRILYKMNCKLRQMYLRMYIQDKTLTEDSRTFLTTTNTLNQRGIPTCMYQDKTTCVPS